MGYVGYDEMNADRQRAEFDPREVLSVTGIAVIGLLLFVLGWGCHAWYVDWFGDDKAEVVEELREDLEAEMKKELDKEIDLVKRELKAEHRVELLEQKLKVERLLRNEDIAEARSEWDRVARSEPTRISYAVPESQPVVRPMIMPQRVVVGQPLFGRPRVFVTRDPFRRRSLIIGGPRWP